MFVYRISHKDYSDKLFAPGIAGRWNGTGRKVIYASESIPLDPAPEHRAVDPVVVADEEASRSLERAGLDDLLRRPLGRGVLRDVEVQDSAPLECLDFHKNRSDDVNHVV